MIRLDAIKKANFWSYVALCGREFMLEKGKGANISDRKREALEGIVKGVNLPNARITSLLNEIESALKHNMYELRKVRIRAISRGLVGVSSTFGKVLFEVGLTLDPIMNFPYIPGSTLKGAVSNALFELLLIRSKKNIAETKAEAEKQCRRLFGGSNEGAGLVGFTDAYPVAAGEKGYVVYPDVMSPHYNEQVKTELDVQPIPIVYLSIAPGTVFQFYLLLKRSRGKEDKKREIRVGNSENADITEKTTPKKEELGLLDSAVLYAFSRGVGAKTSVGYSTFEVISYESVKG
nr:type III-B CRISPR module RAMP protein Cmr6 [Candidatus Freyarchaeota archaeon]